MNVLGLISQLIGIETLRLTSGIVRFEGERRGGVCAREKGRRRSAASIYVESRESREREQRRRVEASCVLENGLRKNFP